MSERTETGYFGRAKRTLDDEIRPEDTHGSDTNTGLGGSVGGAEAGEDDGCGAAHGAEEGLKREVRI